MESILVIVGGVARLLAILGGVLSAVFIAYAGIQWMSASGDPQKMATARNSLIGALVGLVIVGIAFLVPGIISELVIEPAGGAAVTAGVGFDCDGALKQQLVVQRTADNRARMQTVVRLVQVQRDECSVEDWNPTVFTGPVGNCEGLDGSPYTVGRVPFPRGMMSGNPLKPAATVSRRDSRNNVMVYFGITGSPGEGLPSDGSNCWLYSSSLGVWGSGS